MESKKCVTCKEIKDVSEFGRYKDGYQKQCKKCSREYYLKNKNKKKEKTQVTTYLDEIELQILDDKVKMLNSDRNSFLKKLILENTTKPLVKIDFSSLDKLAYEINKIGININQIAHIANSERRIYKSDIEYIREKQERIEDMLCKYYDVVLILQRKIEK